VPIEAAWLAVLVGHGIGLDHALAGADRANPADAALAVANHLLLDDEALFAGINEERVPEGLLPCGRR
jgi:hypothetical protein